MNHYLSIDVGGTGIKYALMNDQAEILEKGEVATPKNDLEGFLDVIVAIYEKYADQNLQALAMSAPGKIDSDRSYFYTSGALMYLDGVNLADRLKDRIPLEISVLNDAKSAALAELWKGSMKGKKSGIVMTLGTGIGGALIIDGKLWRGNTNCAGEFSGIPMRWDKPTMMQGQDWWCSKYCTQALTTSYALKKGIDPSSINGKDYFEQVNQNDKVAVACLDEFCDSLATGLLGMQLILDVEHISIGGGISRQKVLIDTLNRKVKELFDRIPSQVPASRMEISACQFSNDANLIGALYFYLVEHGLLSEA